MILQGVKIEVNKILPDAATGETGLFLFAGGLLFKECEVFEQIEVPPSGLLTSLEDLFNFGNLL